MAELCQIEGETRVSEVAAGIEETACYLTAPYVTCSHCGPLGCGVYESRPLMCRGWSVKSQVPLMFVRATDSAFRFGRGRYGGPN